MPETYFRRNGVGVVAIEQVPNEPVDATCAGVTNVQY
jgi:hypothetical protein